mgnify:CR=1 FL=1
MRLYDCKYLEDGMRHAPTMGHVGNWNLYNYSSNFPYFTGFPACSLVK